MFNYSKPRTKSTLSSKDGSAYLGPHLSVQASASTVNERKARPYEKPSESPVAKLNESYNSGSLLGVRRSLSNSQSSEVLIHSRQSSAGKVGTEHRRSLTPASATNTAYSTIARPAPKTADSASKLFTRRHYMPTGDRVVITPSSSTPECFVVCRPDEEKTASPDRLNLDRRRLTLCPVLEGEEQLRLLNYQHNSITHIQHLNGLRRLIFLDLYDNKIEHISGLDSLKALRVLMLGKNRISKIENLEMLTKLDVLDLHGNKITRIENLGHLKELRVLNLAGNLIDYVDMLSGMDALTELNLRRNRIKTIRDVHHLESLQRLFLSCNEITSLEHISSVTESRTIQELSLDGNPLAHEQNYKQCVLRHMQNLQQLDMKKISDDERRIACVMARKDEEKKRESNKMAALKERRRLAINNARRQWEMMQGSMMSRSNRLVRPELVASHVANIPNHTVNGGTLGVPSIETIDTLDVSDIESLKSSHSSRPTSAKSIQSENDWSKKGTAKRPMSHDVSKSFSRLPTPDKQNSSIVSIPDSGIGSLSSDHVAEINGDTLYLIGTGVLSSLEKNYGIQAAGAVICISFKFIDFDQISNYLPRIRTRFPSVYALIFSNCSIHSFHQINALASLRRLENVTIEPEGNPITNFTLWRSYTLFRLAHFGLKRINDVEVSASDIVNAEKFFGPLAHITTSQLPQTRLITLLGETKRKQLLSAADEKSSRSKLSTIDKTLTSDRTAAANENVGRAGLIYQSNETIESKAQLQQQRYDMCHSYVHNLSKEAILTAEKRSVLERVWPRVLHNMIRQAAIEMTDIDTYMKNCMEKLEKT